jgi:hypothetical protein
VVIADVADQARHGHRRGAACVCAQHHRIAIQGVEEQAVEAAGREGVDAGEDAAAPFRGPRIHNDTAPRGVSPEDPSRIDRLRRCLAQAQIREHLHAGTLELVEPARVEVIRLHDDPVEAP